MYSRVKLVIEKTDNNGYILVDEYSGVDDGGRSFINKEIDVVDCCDYHHADSCSIARLLRQVYNWADVYKSNNTLGKVLTQEVFRNALNKEGYCLIDYANLPADFDDDAPRRLDYADREIDVD